MFKERYKEAVVVRIPSGVFVDGQEEYTEYEGFAMITDVSKRDAKQYGNIQNGKVFLLRCEAPLKPGSCIVHSEQKYDLKEIKVCRDLDGKIECYRCLVF